MADHSTQEQVAAALTAPLLRNNNVTNAEEAVELYRKVLAALRPAVEEKSRPRASTQRPEGW